MSEEISKSKRIIKKIAGLDTFISKIKDKSFYSYYFAKTRYLNIFENRQARETFSSYKGNMIHTPNEQTRKQIIDRLFDGRFDISKNSLFSFKVDKMFTNAMGTFFGGSIVTLIDVLTFINLSLNYSETIMMASATLNTNFLKAAYEGDNLYIKCTVEKVGQKLIFMTCDIYNEKFQKIAQGTHVMAWIVPPSRTNLDAKKTSNAKHPEILSIQERMRSSTQQMSPLNMLQSSPTSKQRILNLMTSFNNMNLTHKNKVLKLLTQNQTRFPKEIQFNPNTHRFKYFVRRPLL